MQWESILRVIDHQMMYGLEELKAIAPVPKVQELQTQILVLTT
ncbi:hypothetical protein X556_0081 [Chlamydia pneumoniae B21]|nr:hypothetical protein X556_0081 [Chlamydia pneumoniae B21]